MSADDGVGLTVEITPLPTATCAVDCSPPSGAGPGSPGGGLPVTGGEMASVLLAVTLVGAGLTATVWARWRRPAADRS
ncbi:hypothetical protein M3667_09860 [Microbacterium sp. P26]|uniref:hypothetical protein n=1 Tax=Microbacterium TaxID=33882 RepID=UPI00203D3802|nr:hypothetical protein [Microbacterium sp. P26]MCM3502175.1 hypothetical protein [Microbacterium sp. P26]